MKGKSIHLDDYEKEVLDYIEKGEYESAPDLEEEKTKLKHAAENTMKKSARINIRIAENDLLKLKSIALDEGLPYQTLISSILHKFVSGRLGRVL